jgi:putative phosphoesterase
MKLGIVSDIHCNIAGLRQALDEMGEIDQLWCAGDVVFQFRWSNDVVELLRDMGARTILGNHDEIILSYHGERALSNPSVRHDLVDWLRSRPYRHEEVVDGRRVLMTHGSPWEPWTAYHYPHETVWTKADTLDCDTLIVGHTHFQMAQRHGSTLVINPGSTGDPRDHRNAFQLSCAVWDTRSDEVVFYDFKDPTRDFAMHSGERPG